MTTQTVGSGLGGSLIIAPQASWGGSPVFTSARTPSIKTAAATWDQHPVQGGPYLRAGQYVDVGSARELIYLDAKATISGDVMSTGFALLLATALGTSATLSAIGTTTAYELGGASGAPIGLPEVNNTFLDAQINTTEVPTGLVLTNTYHSGYCTKAEWVFDRTGMVTFSHDYQFQYVENATAYNAPTVPAAPVPFTMANTSSVFSMGTLGAEAAVSGVKKATFTIERKVASTDELMYLGNQYIIEPVSVDNAKLTVSLEWDNTAQAQAAISALQLAGTPTSIVATAVGGLVANGKNNTFGLNATNCFLDTGGEQSLKGPAIVGNTASFSATLPIAGTTPFQATLITGDTAW